MIGVELSWPERQPGEPDATSAQCLSVARFYTVLPDELGIDQAHALLSYHNFAREAVTAALHLDPEAGQGLTLSRMLAAAISTNERLAAAAVEWSEHNFKHPDAAISVEDSPSYHQVSEIVLRCANQLLS